MSGKKDALANIGGFVGVRDGDCSNTRNSAASSTRAFDLRRPRRTRLGGHGRRPPRGGHTPYIEFPRRQVAELGDLPRRRRSDLRADRRPRGVRESRGVLARYPARAVPDRFSGELYREGGVRAVELGEFAFPGKDRRNSFAFVSPSNLLPRTSGTHRRDVRDGRRRATNSPASKSSGNRQWRNCATSARNWNPSITRIPFSSISTRSTARIDGSHETYGVLYALRATSKEGILPR